MCFNQKWNAILSRVDQKNHEFDLTRDYLLNLLEQQNYRCALSGRPIGFGDDAGRDTASPDRKDSRRGYVRGNMQWVHKDINRMKNAFDQNEFVEVCIAVARNLDLRGNSHHIGETNFIEDAMSPYMMTQIIYDGITAASKERGQRAELVTFVPNFAEWLLAARNPRNRSLKNGLVSRICDDVREHRYSLNGETIVCDWNGDLIDGQHRLRACVLSRLPFDSWMIIGVDPACRETIDSGISRSPGDSISITLSADDIPAKYRNDIARAGREFLVYQKGGNLGGYTNEGTNPQIIEVIKTNPGLKDENRLRIARSIQKQFHISAGSLIVLWNEFAKIDDALAFNLMSSIAAGENLTGTTHHLWKKLGKLREKGTRESKQEALICIMMAWEAIRREKEIMRFHVPEDWRENPPRVYSR